MPFITTDDGHGKYLLRGMFVCRECYNKLVKLTEDSEI